MFCLKWEWKNYLVRLAFVQKYIFGTNIYVHHIKHKDTIVKLSIVLLLCIVGIQRWPKFRWASRLWWTELMSATAFCEPTSKAYMNISESNLTVIFFMKNINWKRFTWSPVSPSHPYQCHKEPLESSINACYVVYWNVESWDIFKHCQRHNGPIGWVLS